MSVFLIYFEKYIAGAAYTATANTPKPEAIPQTFERANHPEALLHLCPINVTFNHKALGGYIIYDGICSEAMISSYRQTAAVQGQRVSLAHFVQQRRLLLPTHMGIYIWFHFFDERQINQVQINATDNAERIKAEHLHTTLHTLRQEVLYLIE